jgi:FAD binding domain
MTGALVPHGTTAYPEADETFRLSVWQEIMSRDIIPGVQVFTPGTDGYRRATSPHNTVARQQPALVAAPVTGEQAAVCVRHAAEHGLRVVPQATGHGAAASLRDDVLLIDTSGLSSIEIDTAHRSARVGAGCQWGDIDTAAFQHGLLGRAGSAPDVGVTGFTFGAGAGWLTRPWGLASGALSAVDYVNGRGELRRAADDASGEIDRDVIWACRGGGGAGLATALEFDLVPVDDLWAGQRLWPIEHLPAITQAWAASLPHFGPALCTSISVLTAPPMPLIPQELHGQRVVHLSMASSTGQADARALLNALDEGPAPVVDTWGRTDVAGLGQIHLDPSRPVPAAGRGRWLDGTAAGYALEVLQAAVDSRILMIEIRNIANDAPVRPGALDRAPGDFMLHAVGAPGEDGDVVALDRDIDAAFAPSAPASTGLAIGTWCDGRASVPDALPAGVRDRVGAIAHAVDPSGILARSPLLTP